MSKNNIIVGAALSLSGRYSYPGKQALAGIMAWSEWTNSRGGIPLGKNANNHTVVIKSYDDRSGRARCVASIKRLITEDRADIIMGPYSSGLMLAASEITSNKNRVIWNHGGALGGVEGSMCVDLLSPASIYFDSVIEYAQICVQRIDKAMVVYSSAGHFPYTVISGAINRLRSIGCDKISINTYLPGARDFSFILEKVEEISPTVLLQVGRIEDDLAFANAIVSAKLRIPVVGLIAAPLKLFYETLGENSAYFVGPSQWELERAKDVNFGPSVDSAISLIKNQGLDFVDYPAAQAFAGCLIAQKCIENSESLEDNLLWDAACELDIRTFYGHFKIDKVTGRQLAHTMPVVQWCGGEKRIVWPL